MQDEEIRYSDTYRSLSATVYRIRFFVFRLTDTDLMICFLSCIICWYIIDNTMSGQKLFLNLFRLDPWGWIWAGVMVALILSLAHKIRPEGNTEQIIRGWVAHRFFAARMPEHDRFWLPVDVRLYLGTAWEKRARKRGKDD